MRQMYDVRLTRDKRQRRVARRRNFRGCRDSMSQGRRDAAVGAPGLKEGSWSWPMEWGIPWRREGTLRCMAGREGGRSYIMITNNDRYERARESKKKKSAVTLDI